MFYFSVGTIQNKVRNLDIVHMYIMLKRTRNPVLEILVAKSISLCNQMKQI